MTIYVGIKKDLAGDDDTSKFFFGGVIPNDRRIIMDGIPMVPERTCHRVPPQKGSLGNGTCSECGSPLLDGNIYCWHCGAKVAS